MGVDSLNSENTIQLDIVIPSFRADVAVLNSIRSLSVPENMIRKIIVVLDDPFHPLRVNFRTGRLLMILLSSGMK